MTALVLRRPRASTESAPVPSPFDLVALQPLMSQSTGSRDVKLAIVDGPVWTTHPALSAANIQALNARSGSCIQKRSPACRHGTFVAGILSANRTADASGIAPGCTLLVRPIFGEADGSDAPSASAAELAEAIFECAEAGARAINVSAAFATPSNATDRALQQSLIYAASRGTIVVAAAGNQGTLGSSALTRYPAVIPVAACSVSGRPLASSNLGASIGTRGIRAPGEGVAGIVDAGEVVASAGGTSVATPFVTGTIGLLWSAFPEASAAAVRHAVLWPRTARRASVVPPLLNAWHSYTYLARQLGRR